MPKISKLMPIGYCQLKRQCKCVKENVNDKLRKEIIKRINSNNINKN